MLTRLTQSALAFAVTVVVYQAYVLLAAPFIEPPLVVPSIGTITASEKSDSIETTHKYRELLAAYFPPGHWTLTQPPITAENGHAMIIIDEFNPRDDGQVRVKKCAILFFPRGRVGGEPPPSDAVVLEAPHGAVLQMDKSLRRGIGSLGRLQWGKLTGEITVRSDMGEPGPQDDLWLRTRDLNINEDLIRTGNLVEMQLGPHWGSGRELEIRLVAVERGRSDQQGPSIGRIDSLEIIKDVQAQLLPGRLSLGPKNQTATETAVAPPVQITSGGKFRFDFSSQVASFFDQVQLRQVHQQGQLDELRCNELFIYFATQVSPPATNSPLGKLSPGLIEAKGTNSLPVVLNAQSQQATARCQRMRIEPGPRRVTFDRGHEVILTYQGNEIHARQIQYEAPPKNSDQQVGNLLAAGNGWLRALDSDKPGAKPFEVRWLENMRLRRINGQPVLTLNGRPLLDMVGLGRLWADHLDLYLREDATDTSEADLLPGDIVPERLVAGGQIAIDSAQLRGQVRQLEVRFDYASDLDSPDSLQLVPPDGSNSRTGQVRLGQRIVGGTRTYDISGETLQMVVTVRDKQPEVTSIDVDGRVVFSESPVTEMIGGAAAKQPLTVKADHLQIRNADSPSAEIALKGRPATITADGMLIRTEELQINRGNSRAWVNAPGEIEMLIDRDLNGKQLASPQPMTIRWQRGMELKQNRITFTGNVQVLTGEGSLDTQQLLVELSAPVQFDGAANQRRIEIARLECSGGVNAVFSQRDALGLASVQTIKLEESFRVNLQTGEIDGRGPGWLESVHLSSGDNPLSDMASNNGRGRLASARPQSQQAQRLRFLGVQFVRGVRGNLNSRQGRRIEVYGNVEAVYGPVDAWEQRLPLAVRGMPGPDTIWISSESLDVAESPLTRLDPNQQSRLGPIELRAKGDVTIEGPAGERGNFTTHSREAKFNQLKKTFILEGDNQLPATLTYQEFRGAPPQYTKARKLTYFQTTGNVKYEGLMSGELRQLAPSR